jgi:hypothetical protein
MSHEIEGLWLDNDSKELGGLAPFWASLVCAA